MKNLNNSKIRWPYDYKKLNPDAAAKRAYDNCKAKCSCSYGVAAGIIGYLADEVGHPFDLIPPDVIQGFKGGIPEHSSICGAIVGACLAIGLVADTDTQDKLIDNLVSWYKGHDFPKFIPDGQKEMVSSVSHSELCRDSVGNWCKAAGVKPLDPQMHERCARLCADVAKYVVQNLNETLC